MHLTAVDRHQIMGAREMDALTLLAGHQIQSPAGTIRVLCPDADQIEDVDSQHCATCGRRHHTLSLNGGALLLSRHSPIHGAKRDGEVFLRHINVAFKIKGIQTVVLYVHAPCGVAYGKKLDFLEVMRLLIEAKMRLKAQRGSSQLKIACFCHVDYNGGDNPAKKRTYFVDRERMTEFLRENGREVRS